MFRIDTSNARPGETECIMPICGCIDAMHGNAFKALVGETSRHFDAVRLIVCDTLDAHNFALEGSELWNEALETCVRSADRWLSKSLPVLNANLHRVAVTRWGELKGPEFSEISAVVQRLYRTKTEVRDYIHSICADYTERAAIRQAAQGFVPNRDAIFARSLNYTLEEIPGTVIYNKRFAAPVIYVGAYFDDPQFLNRHNDTNIDLALPAWCRVADLKTCEMAA